MQITRITEKNAEYFEHVLPSDISADEELINIGAISEDGEACACISLGVYADMAYIKWLYTDPSRRGEGAASALLEAADSLIRETEIVGIEADFLEDEEGVREFFSENGFLIGADQETYEVNISDLLYGESMDSIRERHAGAHHVVSYGNKEVQQPLLKFIVKHGLDKSSLEDISPEYSLVRVDDKGHVNGCILIREMDDDLKIDYLVSDLSLDSISDIVIGLADLLDKNEKGENKLIFTDRAGKAIGFVETLTGEDRDTYRVGRIDHAVRLCERKTKSQA